MMNEDEQNNESMDIVVNLSFAHTLRERRDVIPTFG